jgi:hypothetical protein
LGVIPIGEILNIGGKLIDKLLPDPEAKAKAQLELAKLAQSGDLAKMQADLDAYKVEQDNLTKRMEADMASDSWLSKNIRPVTLAYILSAYLVLAVLDGAAMDIGDAFVELLGQWGMLVMSFYFGGRTMEKIMEMRSKAK